MCLETRLRHLEKRSAALRRGSIRILCRIIDPDPAIGVSSVVVFEPGAAVPRKFERQPSETVEDLCARAESALGWNVPDD